MINVHPTPHGAAGALGLLGSTAPSAPTSGAAAARGPRGRQAFEDDLDASLARERKDGDDSEPLDASATATSPPRVMEHRTRADRRDAVDKRDAPDAHAAKTADDTATDACNAPARDAAAATDDAQGEQDSAAQATVSESAEEAASQGDAHQDTATPAVGPVAAAVAATATAPSATTTAETETARAASDPQNAANAVYSAEGTADTAKTPVTAAVAAILADATASTESPLDAGVTTSAAAEAQPETAAQPANGVFDQLAGNTTDQDRDDDAPSDAAAKAAPHAGARESFTAAIAQAADDRMTMADATQLAATPAAAATTTARHAELDTARAAFTMGGGQDTPGPDTTDRIVQSMRFQFQRGGGDAIVHIKPEHLGPLSISLRVENGVVQAHVTTENPVVAEWLKANEETLREGLKASGLALDRLVVDPDSSGRAPQRDWSQARRAQRRRFNTDRQSTFELTV